MRKLIGAGVALVVLVAAYWGWALAGAAQLASAASRGDAQAVMERVDLTSLSRSLSGQLSRAYLDQNPQLQKLALLPQGGLVMNASAAEMLLRAVLTPENIAALLNRGHVGLPKGDADTLWRMPALGEAFGPDLMHTLTSSYFDSPLTFVVNLASPDGPYGVHLRLSGMTWRLSGLDVPETVTARVAHEIAERVSGSIDHPGG